MEKKFTLVFALLLLLSFPTVATQSSSTFTTDGSWVSIAPMHEARENLGVVAVNGKIYAIGGDTLSGFWTYSMGFSGTPVGGVVGTNEEYDPATNQWTIKTSMPTPRTGIAIAAYENKIYCIGGSTTYDIYSSRTLTAINEVYDVTTGTWQTKTPMPAATWQVTANVVNGIIYIVDWNGETYAYNIAMDSWSTKSSAPRPMASAGMGQVSAVVNDKIHIIGGFSSSGDSNVHQIYDPSIDNWSYASAPPNSVGNAVGRGAATSTTGEFALERIYVFGQQGNLRQGEPRGSNRIYNPQNDSWEFGTDLPTNRINFATVAVDELIYVIGGGVATSWFVGTFSPSAVTEKYTPAGYGMPDPYVLQHTPPQISFESPLMQTYNSSSIPLIFNVSKKVAWMSYSLDNQKNVTLTGNDTLANLSNGQHNITVYANDTFGNIGSNTIAFIVTKPEPESFPTLGLVVGLATIIVVCTATALWIRRYRDKACKSFA